MSNKWSIGPGGKAPAELAKALTEAERKPYRERMEYELGVIIQMVFDDAAHPDNLLCPCHGIAALRNDRHLTVIVDEADAREPVMSSALSQAKTPEIPHVDAQL